jgi:hypothetical protein
MHGRIQINYEVTYDYKVIRGTPTEQEIGELLARTFPHLNQGSMRSIIGIDENGHVCNTPFNWTIPGEYHESWTTLLDVTFWSWKGNHEEQQQVTQAAST